MTTEDQQEYVEAHRGLGSMRGDARKREEATLNSGFRVAAEQVADSIDSVTDSVSPEQHACNRDGEFDRSVCVACGGAYAACSVCGTYYCECTLPAGDVDTPTIGSKIRAAIEADVLRRVTKRLDEDPRRGCGDWLDGYCDALDALDAEADRIEEGSR